MRDWIVRRSLRRRGGFWEVDVYVDLTVCGRT